MYQSAMPLAGSYDAADENEDIYQQGYHFWNEGDYAAALECFARLAISHPLEPRFMFAFACALEAEGDILPALNLFLHTREMQADNPWIYFHIACCLNSQGQLVEARYALEDAILLCNAGSDGQHFSLLRQRADAMLAQLRY